MYKVNISRSLVLDWYNMIQIPATLSLVVKYSLHTRVRNDGKCKWFKDQLCASRRSQELWPVLRK